MLDGSQFAQWCRQMDLPSNGRLYIEQLRSSPPQRRVRSAKGNVSGRYPSRKMGVTIQFESHRHELAGIYEMEYDPDVLEYYDQPPAIKLCYQALNGRRVGVLHTPDFFVLRQESAGWEEWKTASQLVLLTAKMPNRYIQEATEQWRCPPGEDIARALGLYYRIRSNAEINWTLQENWQFLEDYLRGQSLPIEEKNCTFIRSLVSQQPGITLAELKEFGLSTDDIYALIASERLSVNLSKVSLATAGEQLQIFPAHQTAIASPIWLPHTAVYPQESNNLIKLKVGEPLNWDGNSWEIMNVGETQTALINQASQVIQLPNEALLDLFKQGELTGIKPSHLSESRINDILAKASDSDCAEANRRYEIIAPYLTGAQSTHSNVSTRTIRRWLRAWRQAENQYRCGYIGLLPRVSNKGNSQPKLPTLTQKLIDDVIANEYETLKQKGKFAVYSSLVRACTQQGITSPSYKTFVKKLNNKSNYEQTAKRQGPRAAYQHEPFYWELELSTPRHGNRPFEICHIDHTELDIELVSSRTSVNLGRPWVTFLTDAYSRRILALYLTFDPPSYRSCMMVMRECVRRHQRLPQSVVVDGGKEFQSIYFERLLATYFCTKKTRPVAKPRFGSVCERLFGTANTMFIHNLQGNTQLTRKTRQVTSSVNPRKQAIWTLGSLYQNLCDWAYEFYDNKEHPTLGLSPRITYESGLIQTGLRSHKLIPYDETFRILTLPTTAKGTAKVIPNQGVKINHIYYWHNSFRSREVEKTQVSVRYDPYDAGVAYAYVKGQWVSCISQYYSSFHGRSEREIRAASSELLQQHKNSSKQFTANAKALAEFLAGAEATEALLLQRLRDAEAKDILSAMDSGLRNFSGERVSVSTEFTKSTQPREEIDFESANAPENEGEIHPYEEFW